MPDVASVPRPWRVALTLFATAGLLLATMLAGAPAGAARTPKLRPYATAGLPTVSGADNAVDAPLLSPGRYVDSLDTADENSSGTEGGTFYRIMLRADDTPYVTATLVPPARADSESFTTLGVTIYLRPVDRGNIACSFSASSTHTDLNTATAVLSPGRVGGPDWNDNCPVNAAYGVQVLRTGDAYTGTALPTEIAFRLEPSARTAGVAGPASTQANRQPATPARAAAKIDDNVADSFDDAPLLAPGQYRDTFTTGETRYYRVHLDWGQRLAYTLTVDQDPDVEDPDGSDGHTIITNPLREPVGQPVRAKVTEDYLGSTGGPLTGSTLVPVRYTNRDSDADDIQAYAVDGDYYLAFSTDFPTGEQPTIHVGFTLVIDVFGTKEASPVYSRGGPLPESATQNGGVSSTVVIAAVAGGVVVLAVAAGVVLVRRRRVRQVRVQT